MIISLKDTAEVSRELSLRLRISTDRHKGISGHIQVFSQNRFCVVVAVVYKTCKPHQVGFACNQIYLIQIAVTVKVVVPFVYTCRSITSTVCASSFGKGTT